MIKYLPLVLKNSLRSKRRTALTILSIAASLCLLGVLGAVYHMFFLTEANEDQALRLVVRNRVSLTRPIPIFYRDKILGVPGVKDVMVFQWFQGVYKDSRDPNNFFPRFAVDADRLFQVYPEYKVPEDQKKAFLQERQSCIVGRKLANRLGFKLGDRIPVQGDIYPVNLEFVIRGIYESAIDNENLIFHNEYMVEALKDTYMSGMANLVGTFVVRAESADEVPRIAGTIDEMFRNSTMQTKSETQKQFELSFLSFLGNVKLFLLCVCGAVTFTIMLVSGNTMAMSVRERVREVGVLKTLGFTQGTILAVIVGEAVMIAIVGGLVGLTLAAAVCGFMRSLPSTFADMSQVLMPPFVWAAAMGIAILIGLLSSVVPAWSASRRSIVEALRYTD